MFNDNWQAQIVFTPGRIANAIYLSRSREFGVREFLKSDDTIITVKNGEPSDNIEFAYLDDDQLRALMVALDNHGVKRPDAGFTEGKLEATEKHLEDMRTFAMGSLAAPFDPTMIDPLMEGKL